MNPIMSKTTENKKRARPEYFTSTHDILDKLVAHENPVTRAVYKDILRNRIDKL